MTYIRNTYGSRREDREQDPISIQNKIIQTITCLFTALYISEWPSFFDDLLALSVNEDAIAQAKRLGVSFYLKVLISIHDEIADVLVPRSPEEQLRDTSLKDRVRQSDAKKIAESWQDILMRWKSKDDVVVEQCLLAIGKWASWTDISLIINENLLHLLFELVGSSQKLQRDQVESLRDASLNTFTEILAKKMKPSDKLDLVIILRINEIVGQLTASPSLNAMRSTSNYDNDLAESVAKLVNNTVYDVVNILDSNADKSTQNRANDQLKIFLPYVLRFFSDDYDEICSGVIPCLTDLLTYLRKKTRADVDYASMLPPILQAIVAKMKYDETSSWGNEDAQTDEAEFQELRKRLQVLQQAVAAVDESLYIDTIGNIISTSLHTFQNQRGQVDWRDIDLAMHELFLFGELAVKNGGLYSKTKPVSPAAERLIGLMFEFVESGER